jgi:hypothetical protein
MASRPLPTAPGETRRTLDAVIDQFRGDIANAAAHMAIDGQARGVYDRLINRLAGELRDEAAQGRITWRVAAERAQQVRNATMEIIRGRSTPVGRALAQRLKSEGRTLNELVARKTVQLFGRGANFSRLSVAQQNAVYAAIVDSAGRSNPQITARMWRVSVAGRALLLVSVALAVYNIATAEDHVAAAQREGALLGGGIAGGIAGGALAGLMCGPGAPVCVTVGAFLGGAAAGLGISLFY